MNIRTSAFRRLAILSLSALAFAACDEKTPTTVIPRAEVEVSITPSSATLQVGQTATFVANVNNDTTGTLSGVTYSSTNAAVASVNASTGVVTAVAPGTTTIIATSKFKTSKTAAAQVIVTAAPTPVVSIALAPSAATVNVGGTVNLVAIVTGTANTAVTYSTSDATVATVSNTGVVTATQKNGTAVITATSVADASKSAVSVITVTGGIQPGQTQITISPPAATIEVGGTFTFVANVTGNTNTAKTFTSSDPTVATVNATTGVVTALNKAGTTVISAIATADPTKIATATLTVTRPTVTVTASPSAVTLSPQQTTTITSTVTGSAADIAAGVTCTSSDNAVATVNNCVVTAVSAGTATITVRSVGDPTKTALVTVTVAAQTQPSISIESVRTVSPTPVSIGSGATVAGSFTVRVNVTAGSATNIQRVAIRLNGIEACSQTFNPPLAPTGGVAQIDCVVNTAQLTSNGAAVFSNGVYTLTADAFSTANVVVATATFGTLNLQNTNTVSGTVTYDNSLSDADNTPMAAQSIAAGTVWNGGSATVTVIPAVFTGTPAADLVITMDLGCDGSAAGDPSIQANVVNGTATATFSEALLTGSAPTPGNDNVEQATVCYLVGSMRAANTTAITLPAGSGTGDVASVGAAPTAAQADAVDNVPPTFALAPAFSPAFTGASQNSYASSNTSFAVGSPALINTTATDAGVGGITYAFYAVPAGTAVATQANMRTAVAGGTLVTNGGDLPSSTTSNTAYILIQRAMDALGNTVYANVGTFGVDREVPTIAVGAGSIAQNGTVNDGASDIVVAVTDTFSGPISLRFRGTIYSVLEVDADAGTEVRCLADAVGTVAAVGPSGVCPLLTLTPLTNIGGQTEQGTIVTPTAAAGPNEGYYVVDVQGTDRAGNVSATTLNFVTLNDVTAPTAVINIITTNNINGTTELTGQIRENVDLQQFDTRFTYTGLAGVPDDVPFVTPTAVETYGLPLVGVRDVNTISSATVRDITDGTGTVIPASAYGFGATDVAQNYSFTGQPITNTAGTGVAGLFGGAFPTDFDASFIARSDAPGSSNTATIDRNASGGIPSSTPMFAQVRTISTAQNPLANVHFYIVHPGADNISGNGDDYNVLVATRSASTATVVTGITDRTYTFSTTVDTNVLPRTAPTFTYPMYAIGVASNGSAIMSDIINITIQD